MFEKFPVSVGDPILSLQQTYAQDRRQNKINLSIGLYYDENGHVPQLLAVQRAEEILRQRAGPSLYQPMAGAADYRRAVQSLLFDEKHPKITAGHVATIQTIGGSGALKVGSDLLKQFFPDSEVWISNPSWDNHTAIFEGSGFSVKRYPYFDTETSGIDFDALCTCLGRLPARTIVLFHPCCHNPTGADLANSQWDKVIDIALSRKLIPFLDMAYQGFGEDLDADSYAIKAMADAGISFLVSNSFSKTFSLYGERCGGLSIVCQNPDEAARALGQMELTVRRNYSSPPAHGARLVASILLDRELKSLWQSELGTMRDRVKSMRKELHSVLRSERPNMNFDYLLTQRGMFSYTGLSADRVKDLRTRFGIYLVESGRLCLTGLNTQNVQRVGRALAQVMPSFS